MTEQNHIMLIEVERAQKAVGNVPMQRLKWALSFAARDIGSLTAADWINLRLQLFAFNASLIWWDRMPQALRDRFMPMFGNHSRVPGTLEPGWFPTEKQVKEVHKWLGRFLSDYKPGFEQVIGPLKGVRLKIGQKALSSDASDLPDVPFYGSAGTSTSLLKGAWLEPLSCFIIQFGELAQGFADKLHRCADPDCRGWFIGRANKQYHKKCLNRITQARFRNKKGTKPEAESGDRRKRHGKRSR